MPKEKLLQQINEALDTKCSDFPAFGINPNELTKPTYGLTYQRRSLATAAIGLMMQSEDPHFTLDDIMDPTRYDYMRKEFGKKAVELYKAGDYKSLGNAYLTVLRECSAYFKKNFQVGMAPQDYLKPGKNKLLHAIVIFTDASQEIVAKQGKNQYLYMLTDAPKDEIEDYQKLNQIFNMPCPYYKAVFNHAKAVYENDQKELKSQTIETVMVSAASPILQDQLLKNDEYKKYSLPELLIKIQGSKTSTAILDALKGIKKYYGDEKIRDYCLNLMLDGRLEKALVSEKDGKLQVSTREKTEAFLWENLPEELKQSMQIPDEIKNYADSVRRGEPFTAEKAEEIIASVARNELIKNGASEEKVNNAKNIAANILGSKEGTELKERLISLAADEDGKYFISNIIFNGELSKNLCSVREGELSLNLPKLNEKLNEYQINRLLSQEAAKQGYGLSEFFQYNSFVSDTGQECMFPDNAAAYAAEAISKGNRMFLYLKDESGKVQPREVCVHNNAIVLSSESPMEYIREKRQAILDRLQSIYDVLDETGTSRRDSEEYSKMMAVFEESADSIAHTNNFAEMHSYIRDIADAAKNYYVAKLTQSHNEKRSIRFGEAIKLMCFENPEISEKDILLQTLAAKAAKAHMDASGYKDAQSEKYEDVKRLNSKILDARSEQTLKSAKFKQLYENKTIDELKSLIRQDGKPLAMSPYSESDIQNDNYPADSFERSKAASVIANNALSGGFFNIWNSDEEMHQIKEYPEVLGLVSRRSGLSQIVAGRMLMAGYSLEEVLDPNKHQAERKLIGELTVKKFKEACEASRRPGKPTPENQKKLDALGFFAAEAYYKALEVSKAYVLAKKDDVRTYTDLIKPENRYYQAAVKLYIESGQDMMKTPLRDEYFAKVTGMSLSKIRKMRDEQDKICENASYCINTGTDLDRLYTGSREVNINMLLARIGTTVMSKVADPDNNPLQGSKEKSAGWFSEMISIVSDHSRHENLYEKICKTTKGKELLVKYFSRENIENILFTPNEEGEVEFQVDTLNKDLDEILAQARSIDAEAKKNEAKEKSEPQADAPEEDINQEEAANYYHLYSASENAESFESVVADTYINKVLNTIENNGQTNSVDENDLSYFEEMVKLDRTVVKGVLMNTLSENSDFKELAKNAKPSDYQALADKFCRKPPAGYGKLAEKADLKLGYTKNKVLDTLDENIRYQQYKLLTLSEQVDAFNKKASQFTGDEKQFQELQNLAKKNREFVQKTRKDICANILANAYLKEKINTEGNEYSIDDFNTKFNQAAVKKAVKEMKGCAAFKELYGGKGFHMSPLMMKSDNTLPEDQRYPKESVEKMFKDLQSIARAHEKELGTKSSELGNNLSNQVSNK